MDISKLLRDILLRAYNTAKENKNEYVTPEHLILGALEYDVFKNVIIKLNGNVDVLKEDLKKYIDQHIDKIRDDEDPEESFGIKNVLILATQQAAFSERKYVSLEHVLAAIYALKDSYAVYYLQKQGISKHDLLFELSHNKSEEESLEKDAIKIIRIDKSEENKGRKEKGIISSFCTNLTELINEEDNYPLVGRKDIIDRTIQILCRRTKNNPIHIGEPGVGKTAITMGLARLIK